MLIIPAIDIINGEPVRLYQGDYSKKQIVASSALNIAKEFQDSGAEYLHLVDLDAARIGKPFNAELIINIAKSVSMKTEVGGGIRNMEQVEFYLNNGIDRVILGTAAIEDEHFLLEAISKYPDSIAVGIDCKEGYACGRGWLSDSNKEYISFAKELQEKGVKIIIFTDISKDGTLMGPNLEMLKALREAVSIHIIASGGIKDLEDVMEIKRLGIDSTIIGKAIYSNTLDLKETILASNTVSLGGRKCIEKE